MEILNLDQRSEAWHEFRLSGIGSSDIARIAGVSPWGTARDVYFEKIGLSDGAQINRAMQRGIDHESDALAKFNDERNANFKPVCIRSSGWKHAIASLDGFDGETVLEIKIPGEKTLMKALVGDIDEHYLVQMQWQMYVANASSAFFVCYNPENNYLLTREVKRDDVMIEDLLLKAAEFWQQLEAGKIPEETTPGVVEVDNPKAREVAARLLDIEDQLAPLKDAVKPLEEQKKKAKKELEEYGDDGNFAVGRVLMSRVSPKASYDIEAMKRDGIDVDKYKKVSIGYYKLTIKKE